MPTESYKRIKGAANTVAILDAVSVGVGRDGSVSAQDVADRVGMPRSTALCYLETLRDSGWVEAAGAHYTLGVKVGRLWARLMAREQARRDRAEENVRMLQG